MSLPLPFLHCLCMGERLKEESSRQLMSVWLFHLKKTQRRLHRLHALPKFRSESNVCDPRSRGSDLNEMICAPRSRSSDLNQMICDKMICDKMICAPRSRGSDLNQMICDPRSRSSDLNQMICDPRSRSSDLNQMICDPRSRSSDLNQMFAIRTPEVQI